MTESKADAADTKDETKGSTDENKTSSTTKAPRKPRKPVVKTTSANDTQVPAPSVAAAATATPANADAPVNAREAADFGPFQDTAPPVGPAVEALQENLDTTADFDAKDVPFTHVEGDIYVAVRQQNQRNVVDIAVAGEVNSAKTLAPYQIKALHKALGEVLKKLK